MAGGALMGLGRGIESAGDAYARAKQAAIDRMFREQQLAMQQQQLDATLENQAFDREYKVRSQLPAGSDLAGFGDPRFASIFSPLEKRGTRPDPTLPAKTLPMPVTLPPTTGEGEWQGSPAMPVQQTEATMPVQDLTPKIDTRTSVPFEDTRARTAMYTEEGRRQRAAANQQTRMLIQGMRDQVQREILAARERHDLESEKIGWARLNQMEAALKSLDEYRDASVLHMANQDDLERYRLQYGTPRSDDGNDFQRLFIESILNRNRPAGAAPVVPGAGTKKKEARPEPPPNRPLTPGQATPAKPSSPYEDYLKRRGQ